MKDLIDQFDDERRRLARKLHSEALQDLTALQLHLSLIPSEALPQHAAKALKDASELAQCCSKKIRCVCGDLHPPLLEEFGLRAALAALAAERGVEVSADLPQNAPIPARTAIGAFRIVEEISAGSPGDRIHIGLIPDALCISAGGTREKWSDSVRARVERLAGRHWRFCTGGTETIRIELPLTSEES